jgi:hypothetical protein
MATPPVAPPIADKTCICQAWMAPCPRTFIYKCDKYCTDETGFTACLLTSQDKATLSLYTFVFSAPFEPRFGLSQMHAHVCTMCMKRTRTRCRCPYEHVVVRHVCNCVPFLCSECCAQANHASPESLPCVFCGPETTRTRPPPPPPPAPKPKPKPKSSRTRKHERVRKRKRNAPTYADFDSDSDFEEYEFNLHTRVYADCSDDDDD